MPTLLPARRAFAFAGALVFALVGGGATAGAADAATAAYSGRYVSLGDSYVSGPLIPAQSGGECLRSSQNYASLTASALGYTLDDVSCSGATTDNMAGSQTDVLGTVINAPQLTAVTPDTKLVTLGIGGNDIGFIDIIETCAGESLSNPFGDPCTEHYTAGGVDRLENAIEQTGPKVASVLQQIHQRAPHAAVYVVGYPDILPEDSDGCWPVVPISYGDIAYLRQVEKELNQMLADEAAVNGASYVDTYTPTIGHDVCQDVGAKWIEGLVPTSPAAPFHPNALGEAAMGKALEAAIG